MFSHFGRLIFRPGHIAIKFNEISEEQKEYIDFDLTMKNSLELQITLKIKQANLSYSSTDFQQALAQYQESLNLYHENKMTNDSISPHFQSSINSLISLAHMGLGNLSEAEHCLNMSLKLSPHNSPSLIRRAKVYLKMDRFLQAIEDLERAYVSEPENRNILELIQETKNNIEQIQDEEERNRMQKLLLMVSTSSVDCESEELSEEEILSFSNLKEIDRSTGYTRNMNKKTSIFREAEEYDSSREDQTERTISQNNEYGNQLTLPVTIISKVKSSDNSQTKARVSSNFKRQDSLQEIIKENQKGNANQKGNEDSKANLLILPSTQSTQKNVSVFSSEKARSSVKFGNTRYSRDEDFEDLREPKNVEPITESSNIVRKSILRTSKILNVKKNSAQEKRISSFFNIKDIDGPLLKNIVSQIVSKDNEQKQNCAENTAHGDNSDSDNEEFNIFGNKNQNKAILNRIQNMSSWSKNESKHGHRKRDSILKKQSIVESSKKMANSMRGSKKSVCFGSEENYHKKMAN